MFDVKHLCPRHILVDSVEVVIIYIDIVHAYQKEAFVHRMSHMLLFG
jgi:hypothetical protein